MTAIADELDGLAALATRINLLPGPNRCRPEVWYHERDEIARAMARAIGRLRKQLGLKDSGPTSFAAIGSSDSGVTSVRQARGTSDRPIPVIRRGRAPSRQQLLAARAAL
ncbi:MAG: hypothetical protein ACREHV_01080 [Rhizomicrobium sp.]